MKLLISILLIAFSCSLIAQEQNIHLNTDNNDRDFGSLIFETMSESQLTSYSQEQLRKTFPVYYGRFEDKPSADRPSLIGTYNIVESRVVFKPRFPFTQGKTYTAFVSHSQRSYQFTIPELSKPPSNQVSAVYPTVDALPANLLKVYIAFEQPMQFGNAYDNIVLLTQQGDPVDAPFLEIEQELWDKERTLFTLWLDPGRIKRDLSPNQLLGNPLEENKAYQLVIKKDWKDVYGNSLAQDFVKPFRVNTYDRTKPSEKNWRFEYPGAGTQDPIVISFDEPLDYGTLLNGFQIEHQQLVLDVKFRISSAESKVLIAPATPWKKGRYQFFINPRIEDLAGNNLNRLFDTNLSKGEVSEKEREEIVVEFTIE